MQHVIVPLEVAGDDWTNIVRFVEQSGRPLWLEADGEVRGVLLPTAQACRLMGRYTAKRDDTHVSRDCGVQADDGHFGGGACA